MLTNARKKLLVLTEEFVSTTLAHTHVDVQRNGQDHNVKKVAIFISM